LQRKFEVLALDESAQSRYDEWKRERGEPEKLPEADSQALLFDEAEQPF
jgi:hypothetical protein